MLEDIFEIFPLLWPAGTLLIVAAASLSRVAVNQKRITFARGPTFIVAGIVARVFLPLRLRLFYADRSPVIQKVGLREGERVEAVSSTERVRHTIGFEPGAPLSTAGLFSGNSASTDDSRGVARGKTRSLLRDLSYPRLNGFQAARAESTISSQ